MVSERRVAEVAARKREQDGIEGEGGQREKEGERGEKDRLRGPP